MIYQVRFLQWKIRIHRRNVIFCFNWLLLDFQRLSRQMIFVINFFTLIQCTGIGLWLFRIVLAFMRHNIVGFHLNIRTTPPITFKCRFAIVCSKCRVRKISSEIFKFFNPFLPFFNNFFILFIIDI